LRLSPTTQSSLFSRLFQTARLPRQARPHTRATHLALGVGPIDFPAYLHRLEVVTATSPNQLDLSAEKRWGEPLDKDFSRVLTENLTQLLNTQQVEMYPWSRKVRVDYQIVVEVQRFETNSNGQSQLAARWIIKDGATGKNLYASETRASASVGTGEAAASVALSENLATLSRDIASRVAELNQHRSVTRTGPNDLG
jgi:hypothetical protein